MNRRDFLTGLATGTVVGASAGAGGVYAWDRYGSKQPMMPEFSRLSFSQQGEDIVLFHALHDLFKLDKPTYMDVGAAHPVRSSNTYLLYGTGSRGVLVEPNPMYVKMLRDWRPGDQVVAAGIGITDMAEADYYEIKGNALLNTFSPEQVEMLKKGGTEVERVTKMPLININKVITDTLGKTPDLLSTDVEGLDTAIIRTLDLTRFRPYVICCEGVPYFVNGDQSEIWKFLVPHGYVPRGGSMVNSIFVDGKRIRE